MSLTDAPLGHHVAYPDQYDPTLLFPIERAANRAALGLGAAAHLPFHGADIWTAYELSWLNAKGKPQVAMAVVTIPADSPRLVESKSFKLYLNSLNQTRLDDEALLRERLAQDIGAAVGADVELDLIMPRDFAAQGIAELGGTDLDALDIAIDTYQPAPGLLRHAPDSRDGDIVEETLVSRLLKSNCPVTGQPDWGSVQIRYRGRAIDRVALLKYIVSLRQHAGFHEHCVEQIHTDIMRACAPAELTVYARYTRRGGLDINPWRSNAPGVRVDATRTARQ
ncbi:NADPH-dependent 7-cyano-7-deazaguanine reductase QueF [Bordetella sp. FB-8]|uniref:NADPH-dependent 7-cyano-7-deazaguanine reductase QueF n=1 Tax=Bordetella sp. FB-8 TaxID=1159870 RepID=UPI00036C9CB9|nr:NADPH-dependent 7-cyano-7-deazaguanine reductase QueF [Bordetella sp. FB-8]